MPESPQHPILSRLAAGVVCVVLLAGCSSDADDPDGRSADSTASSSATEPSGGTDPGSSGSAGSGATAPPTDYSTAPVVVESDEAGQLVAVTAESSDGVERLTFEFSGAAPGYRVEQVDGVTAGPEGDVVPISGETFLTVAFTSTTPGTGGPIADGVPTNESYDLPVLRQVVLVHNVGGDLWFGIGLDASAPAFRVVPLDDPTRLVVEVRAD
jgi:hypothetical protein